MEQMHPVHITKEWLDKVHEDNKRAAGDQLHAAFTRAADMLNKPELYSVNDALATFNNHAHSCYNAFRPLISVDHALGVYIEETRYSYMCTLIDFM